MGGYLKRTWILLAFALGMPLTAAADVTYAYTGLNYTSASASWHIPRDVPPGYEEEVAAGIAAGLLATRLTISITLPVYLPAGWNYFSFYQIESPELIETFTQLKNTHAVADPTISWTMSSSGSYSGSVGLGDPTSLWHFFRAGIRVDSDHQVIEWDIAAENWDTEDHLSMQSTSNGDQTAYHLSPSPRGAEDYSASNSVAGRWSVSGVPVAAVPEPASYALLLAGLGLVGAIARRQKRHGRLKQPYRQPCA